MWYISLKVQGEASKKSFHDINNDDNFREVGVLRLKQFESENMGMWDEKECRCDSGGPTVAITLRCNTTVVGTVIVQAPVKLYSGNIVQFPKNLLLYYQKLYL